MKYPIWPDAKNIVLVFGQVSVIKEEYHVGWNIRQYILLHFIRQALHYSNSVHSQRSGPNVVFNTNIIASESKFGLPAPQYWGI
jgi:hypothetical protein